MGARSPFFSFRNKFTFRQISQKCRVFCSVALFFSALVCSTVLYCSLLFCTLLCSVDFPYDKSRSLCTFSPRNSDFSPRNPEHWKNNTILCNMQAVHTAWHPRVASLALRAIHLLRAPHPTKKLYRYVRSATEGCARIAQFSILNFQLLHNCVPPHISYAERVSGCAEIDLCRFAQRSVYGAGGGAARNGRALREICGAVCGKRAGALRL